VQERLRKKAAEKAVKKADGSIIPAADAVAAAEAAAAALLAEEATATGKGKSKRK
jgi:hypothetical protein